MWTVPAEAVLRQKSFFLSVFVDIISWGHICTDRLSDDSSAGLCFSRANADLRYIQSETPSTLQPQPLFDFGLTLKRTLVSKAQTFNELKEACWRKSLDNVYNLWIFTLVLCDKSTCPVPPSQTINEECLRIRVSAVSPCLPSHQDVMKLKEKEI